MTFEKALDIAREWWRDENLAERTMGNYERALRRLDREVRGGLLGPGLPVRLKQWRDRRQEQWRRGVVSSSHVSCDRSALLSFYTALVKAGRMSSNPASALPGVPAQVGLPRPIPVKDQARMLKRVDISTASGLRDRAVLECLRHGMRQGEVAAARISGVSVDGKTLFLKFRAKGRNRKRRERELPLEPTGGALVARYILQRFGRAHAAGKPFEALEKLLRTTRGREDPVFVTDTGRPLYQRWVNRMFNGYRDAADVDPKYTVHTFRHRFCTTLFEEDVDPRTSMGLTGHEDIRSLMRYTQVARKGAVAGVGVIGAAPGV